MKKSTYTIINLLILVFMLLFSYVFYVITTHQRLPDNMDIAFKKGGRFTNSGNFITIYSQNIGFGAFNREFSFVLNGGKYSAAKNDVVVINNINEMAAAAESSRSNIILFQNVDVNSNRSLNKDQSRMITEALLDYGSAFAQNSDTPFLLYPLFNPVGSTQSGILTLFNFSPAKAYRNSLPVPNSLLKYIDLDTCYSVCSFSIANSSKLLWIYNVQLSLLTNEDVKIRQIQALFSDMSEKYAGDDYVICGGSFYYDLTGDSVAALNPNQADEKTPWVKPFPNELLPGGFHYAQPSNKNIATARDPGMPYSGEETLKAITDGYFVSDNVEVLSSTIQNQEFIYSNHHPVLLKITLK